MRVYVLIVMLFLGLKGSAQQLDSLLFAASRPSDTSAFDSADIFIDVVIDASGKLIDTSYVADRSTSKNEQMIAIAKRRALKINYAVTGRPYTQRLRFRFMVSKSTPKSGSK